ncbi:MAG: outer membrane beta-barrel protein [Bacteroidota bacterium]|nr:outer membrane beta-barrel protein [Bacteroidota bacterium]MDP4233568.1 outer membrane beta-barrel protein [Bacteroidota bacterium]MDP4243658.1 outer membrane beta-barrel protein [Bacteroidota bacterium]MDP4287754.1 outer membrane beta-barrel protein [Bacteroidota bacterium]
MRSYLQMPFARWRMGFIITTIITLHLSVRVRAQPQAADSLVWYKSIAVNGLISTSATYNFNRPASAQNQFRVFDIASNSFQFDLFSLTLKHEAALGEAGFRVDVNAGPYIPRIMQSAGFPALNVDFEQAFLSYNAPIGRGLQFDFGKFLCPAGYEYVERSDNYNDNASHSFMFGYAIPYTHTGIRATYPLSDALSAAVLLVNGWDNSVDNNKAKTTCADVSWTPSSGTNVTITAIGGPEKNGNTSDERMVIDFAASFKFSEPLVLGFNADYGSEQNDPVGSHTAGQEETVMQIGTAIWRGAAGYLIATMSQKFSFCLRAEIFDDPNGARTGINQTLHECTLTPCWKPTERLVIRGDLRYDWSTADVFDQQGSMVQFQPTASLNLLYVF